MLGVSVFGGGFESDLSGPVIHHHSNERIQGRMGIEPLKSLHWNEIVLLHAPTHWQYRCQCAPEGFYQFEECVIDQEGNSPRDRWL